MADWYDLIAPYLLLGAVLNICLYNPGNQTVAQQIIPRTLHIIFWPLGLLGLLLLWRARKILKEKKDVATNRHGPC